MIGKTAKLGANFLGAMEYCYYAVLPNRSLDRRQVRGELLYFQHVAPGLVTDPAVANVPGGERLHIEAIARQFAEVARRNERVEKPVWHQVFSFTVQDSSGEETGSPVRSTMVRIAQDFANAFGLADNPMVVFRHSEKDHDHFHIIASRVDLDGTNTAQTVHNYRRVGRFCREMEAKYNLTPTQPMLSMQPAGLPSAAQQQPIDANLKTTRPSRGRWGSTADKIALRQAIDQAVSTSKSMDDFCQRLAVNSPYYVLFVPYMDSTGQAQQGISYGPQADIMRPTTPGYVLGRDYVFGRMIERVATAGRTNSLIADQLAMQDDKEFSEDKRASERHTTGTLAPSLPFAGTAAKHESDIERDIARITRSLNQTVQPEKWGVNSIKGAVPKPSFSKPKRRKGL
ncbi:relaxase/mobilization nuclease domain-containing protein [uncultured Fibrella sp.]|uniref:relaxase/mobilization nuclease domain-containing protein n=1 Tax=uncultured Fibrella sp. TaxID=1284596 RepID=UPI0035CBC020